MAGSEETVERAQPSADLVSSVVFDERGLLPCVVQDWASGEVLMLAYMNREALARTLTTGVVHFWSRSRERLWKKGETSGNVLQLRALRLDCDGDALLALVEPAGPVCHTGERSCFHRGDRSCAPHEALPNLARVIAERGARPTPGSYTAQLLADQGRARAKVLEESQEVGRAVADESDERVAEEAADVLYHLAVLMATRGVPLRAALEVLNARRR